MYESSNWKPLYFTMELLFHCAEKIHLYYIYSRINFNGELPGSDKIPGPQEGYLRSHLGLDTLMVLYGKETGSLSLLSAQGWEKIGCKIIFLLGFKITHFNFKFLQLKLTG